MINKYFYMGLFYPLDPKYINKDNILRNSDYLSTRIGKNGKTKKHYGLDFKAPIGTDVYSASSGKVIYSGVNEKYGNCIIIKHPDGTSSLYAHLNDKPLYNVGENIKGRTKIGNVGKTGNASGNDTPAHLHYERIDNNGTNSITAVAKDSGGT